MTNKFSKAVLIGISDSSLDAKYWREIDALVQTLVFVDKNNSVLIRKETIDADAVLLSFGVPFTKKDIDAAPKLKFIGILATAFGQVDVEYAKSKGVSVCNIPGYSTEAVAEWTFAAILDAIRGLEEGKLRGRSGNYNESGIAAWEIKDKTFGVIGLGSIGMRVAQIATGFGAKIIYWSRSEKLDAKKLGFKLVDIDTLLKTSDFISINLAENSDTKKFLDAEKLAKIKSGAVVINTAPMDIVDIPALLLRLEKCDLTFILDHSDQISSDDAKKLAAHKNCIVYPPIAYITLEARQNKQQIFVENMKKFMADNKLQ